MRNKYALSREKNIAAAHQIICTQEYIPGGDMTRGIQLVSSKAMTACHHRRPRHTDPNLPLLCNVLATRLAAWGLRVEFHASLDLCVEDAVPILIVLRGTLPVGRGLLADLALRGTVLFTHRYRVVCGNPQRVAFSGYRNP
jgi:hypothetical protein